MRILVRIMSLIAVIPSPRGLRMRRMSANGKLNPAKSDFGETTITYEQTAGGDMKVTQDGQSYTFKADGKDYLTP